MNTSLMLLVATVCQHLNYIMRHMQAKLVTLSLKRGIGIGLSFQNISDVLFRCIYN